jgi:hypothetical protein
MRIVRMNVTKALADEWLKQNTRNRDVSETVVRRYAAELRGGYFKETHQGIAFDTNGTLIDGQHRLIAISRTGVPAVIWVALDCDPSTVKVIDDHHKRSNRDTLKVGENVSISRQEEAVAMAMYRSLGDPERVSKSVMTEFVMEHLGAIKWAAAQFAKRPKVSSASVVAVVARAFFREDREKLVKFAKYISNGDGESDMPLVVRNLRNFLLFSSAAGGQAGQARYRKVERALWAYLHNEPITRLFEASEEMFPIPWDSRGSWSATDARG